MAADTPSPTPSTPMDRSPFSDRAEATQSPPREASNSNSESSIVQPTPSSSREASQSNSRTEQRQPKGHAKVRFGSGEALDELGSRTQFALPDITLGDDRNIWSASGGAISSFQPTSTSALGPITPIPTTTARSPRFERFAPSPSFVAGIEELDAESSRPFFESPFHSPRESPRSQSPSDTESTIIGSSRISHRPEPISPPAPSYSGYKAVRTDDGSTPKTSRRSGPDWGPIMSMSAPNSVPCTPEQSEKANPFDSMYQEPESGRSSPTLQSFSVGALQTIGAIPLENNDSLEGKRGSVEHSNNSSLDQEKNSAAAELAKEAHSLVRNHTRRRERGFHEKPFCPTVDPNSVCSTRLPGDATPIDPEHPEDYVPKPKAYRHGVLGSLLTLYSNQDSENLNRPHFPTVSGYTTPTGTLTPGRPSPSPKWYSKSANNSVTSFAGHLAASGTALGGAAAPGINGKPQRPRMKARAHSGNFAEKFRHLARPTVGEEIKISIHIADIIARQRYILKLCRALMLYGAPTHRLEENLRMTSRVLEIDAQYFYVPGCMMLSFGDPMTHTSEMHIVRTEQGVDLGKLDELHTLYKEVVHDCRSVVEATAILDEIMARPKKFSPWVLIPVYGLASAMVGPFGFQARPQDMPILFILGCILGFLQLIVASNSELYANVFEITAAIVTSFLARAFGSINGGNTFCFSALSQASIALILPGYIILCGSLELQSKNMVAGSVRMFYAIVYSLFLGFGVMIGSALYGLLDKNATSATTCSNRLDWRYNFLFVPPFALCLAVINQVKWRQIPMMLTIATAGYVVSWFSSQRFPSQPQISSALGAFVIGAIGNLYSRWVHGLAFAMMLPGIFVQVPGGLAAQGSLLSGVQTANSIVKNATADDQTANSSMVLQLGFNMIQIAIGIACGLFVAALVVYPLGKKRSGLFSF